MKTTYTTLLIIIISFFASCQDGEKGTSYFRVINASGYTTSFYSSDPNVPAYVSFYTYYPTKEGTYNYSYDFGASTYSGSYTIKQNLGEAWNGVTMGIATTPESGKDIKYTFDCDAAAGYELSWKMLSQPHPDIVVDKTIYFKGGEIIIKGKGVYNPNHIQNNVTKNKSFSNH